MNPEKPISGELAILLPILAETMKFAIQALTQSTAVCDLMIAKGVASRQELETAMSSTQKMREKLLQKLDEEIAKQS